MTHSPATLDALEAYWVAQKGRSLGVVGNAGHTVGYHLGRDRIYDGAGPGVGDNDYSVQLPRDKAGLTNAASAIDLGRLDGSLKGLRMFSGWFVDRCTKDAAVRKDIREVIYSPDGATVQRYSGRDNKIHTGPGNGDDSHLTHTHLSFMRDSQARDKVWLFRPYFEEIDMGIAVRLSVTADSDPYDDLGTATLNSGALTRVRDGSSIALPAGTDLGVVQSGTLADGTAIVALTHAGELHVAPRANVAFTPLPRPVPPTPPADTTPFSQADLDAAQAAGVAAEQERIALAEADRIRAV